MTCTRYGSSSFFWAIGVTDAKRKVQAVYIWSDIKEPSVPTVRRFDDFKNGVVPEKVLKTCKDATRVFEAGMWDGAGTLCGKTLESAVKSRLPTVKKEVKGLGRQLSAFKHIPDLTDPFNKLTDAIRVGRNISTHFDENVEIDEETARAPVDSVESVLEFFFVYETKAQALDRRMQAVRQLEAHANAESETEIWFRPLAYLLSERPQLG